MIDRWFIAINGLVVDVGDPEGRHRIRCLIPDISEEVVHDQWIEPMLPWVGAPGYGPCHLPELNSEVLLFGCRGQKYEMFYLSRYNENFLPPGEFTDGARGMRTDGDYRLIADGDLFISGGRVIIEAAASVRITAPAGFFVNGKRIG